ncbi:MAG: gephyrin-like molybdotransferase Glp [Acidimicrobiia bacterium]
MIEFDEVRSAILGAVGRLAPVELESFDTLGLVLAAEVVSTGPIPPFANTAMDGYAVRAQSTVGATDDAPARLRVVGELPAGRAPTIAVGDGEAIRIMTGAPMPDGADAVVMVERTQRDGDDAVLVYQEATAGDHVRRAGGDVEPGEVVFRPGTQLGPAHLGVLASIDVGRVQVFPRARVGVLSTGDELVGSGALRPGKIRDANRPMLLALLDRAGVEAVNLGIARDDEAAMTATLEDALTRCDAVITSGGVSVGDYDYMSAALERIAADDPDDRACVSWYQVAIRPAKPLCFAFVRGRPVFGLPGNPVSSLVSFELFARPALLAMMGRTAPFRAEVIARAEHAFARKFDGKLHLDRVRVRVEDGRYVVASVGKQESNALAATALADGLVLLPDGDGVGEGDEVTVMLLD